MKIVSEKLRKGSGFIGKIINQNGSKFVQVTKSPAIGTIVCIGLDQNDDPIIGWSLISPEENLKDINWKAAQELAIKRATGEEAEYPNLPASSNAQVEHFIERCRCYYKPEKYSRKNQKRPGKLLKVWVDDDGILDGDMTKNINID